MNVTERIDDDASKTAEEVKIMQVDDEIASILTPVCVGIYCVQSSIMKVHWTAAVARLTTMFANKPFEYKYDVCDRLWFQSPLKPTNEKHLPLLNNTIPEELVTDFKLCASCKNSLDWTCHFRIDLSIQISSTGCPHYIRLVYV
ncbi:uncharacterized protein TNCT_556851 [Trichonephila clavata]|uniref:Uncharacterized protein n=1 Tax=Trichonephila clavata TaxID=2740835 RepID=A0A8X6K8B5_TRICU|nr:uncharacterized protein TNCT_556851 [Trichonephila clavata]